MVRHVQRILAMPLIVFTFGAGFLLAGAIVIWAATLQIPDLDTFSERVVRQSTKIYDRTGEILLFDIYENTQRTVVPITDISHFTQNATVAIEDDTFYEHGGVRPLATFRAVFVQPFRGKGVQGGSTITQQVVKNALLTSDKTVGRKLKEWVVSLKIEKQLTKEQILEHYLNEAPYGGNIYGVEEASKSFFGKPASELTLAESAYLAALPQAPTYYSPYGENRESLEDRKNLVLQRMLDIGFITQREYDNARDARVTFLPRGDTRLKAPHFVMYIKEQLEEMYGSRVIEAGGLSVITTLDFSLQQQAQDIVLRHALSNTENFNAENAGMVAVDPQSGEILVMVGSRDYFDSDIDGNFNITLAERQPGSAFKPFVYATAFKQGYTPETVVFDVRTQFSTECISTDFSSEQPCYSPQNYDSVFRGPVTFRNALAQSINIPAVKVLYLTGIDAALATARDLGISTLTNRDQYGLTLVLGGGEVTPLEMASAYGVFANEGTYVKPESILRIETRDGDTLYEARPSPRRVLDENVALTISDILSDNEARTPAFGAQSYLYFPNRDVAAKTGTTNDYRDAWIVGYAPNLAVASWAGNNDNSPMEKRVAGFIVAPMWNEFMRIALTQIPEQRFRRPARDTNLSSLKPVLRGEWQTPDGIHSILHYVDKKDPRGDVPKNPDRDNQYERWEFGVLRWTAENGLNRIAL